MKLIKCPNCESEELRDEWKPGRKLQQSCCGCRWRGQIRTPEIQPIAIEKKIIVAYHGGFKYEIFDKYGHILTSSRSYTSESEAQKELEEELERLRENGSDVWPCTGILWPDVVTVRGKLFK